MADIMRIKVPTTKLTIGDGPDTMDFYGFIRWTIATNPTYNMDASGIRAAVRLERLLEDKPASFDLDQEDLNRLRGAVEAPHGGYPIRPGARCLPFVDAVVNATAAPVVAQEVVES